jgi:hypothetical protein
LALEVLNAELMMPINTEFKQIFAWDLPAIVRTGAKLLLRMASFNVESIL